MNEKMSRKQFAEYVMIRLPMDHMIQFRGVDAKKGELFCIANIHVGDGSCYIANRTKGGHPFYFTYGSRPMFVEHAIKALHKYLCDISAFENGVIVCSESEYPSVNKWTVESLLARMWFVARWGLCNQATWIDAQNKVFRIDRSPKYDHQIKFRIVPFGCGTIVVATEPLYNTDNVRFCCEVTKDTDQKDFNAAVTRYLAEHEIEESDTVTVVRYE